MHIQAIPEDEATPKNGYAPAGSTRFFEWLAGSWTEADTPRFLRLLSRAMPFLVALAVVLAGSRAWLSGKPWMVFFEDDFYYYLKVAQNLAHGSGSTFNGIVQTNGYHPLWLLVITGLSFFTHNGSVIFWFVVSVALICSLALYLLARDLLQSAPVGSFIRNTFAAYIAIYGLHLFYTGMEVILAIPLVFLLMVLILRTRWQTNSWHALRLGLVCSLTVLARLDLILLVGLLVLTVSLNATLRRSLRTPAILAFGLGLLPLAAYFLSNHILFQTWFPVSGMAKQVKFNHAPTLRPWLTFYGRNVNSWLNMAPMHGAILCLPLVWKRLTALQRVVYTPILLFPFVYLGVLCCVSDWQIWLWYLYPLRASLCVSFIIFSMLPLTSTLLRSRGFALLLGILVLAEVAVAKWWTDVQPAIYDAAVDIQNFAKNHSGVYAMGDRSGMVAYLIPYPVIQTEGLVMDRTFLERIRRQEDLITVLNHYGVDYYVGTAWKPYTGCFRAVEPFQAGVTSAHMKAEFCTPALAGSQHEIFRTRIFSVPQETERIRSGR